MRESKCPLFCHPDGDRRGKCGGCAMQHIEYEVQLKNKKERAVHATGFDDVQVFSGEEFWYRNRMDMVFTTNGIGFREKGSWKYRIDVKECKISNQRLNELMKEVWDTFGAVDPFNPRDRSGTYKYATIRTPQNDSSISFVINKESTKCGEAVEKIKDFARKTSANNILVTYIKAKSDMSYGEDFVIIKGSDMLTETLIDKEFKYSAQGFFQNNHEMAQEMHKYVNEIIHKRRDSDTSDTSQYTNLLDLYGGVGTFGIINADLFKSVITVEDFQGCTDAANANIELNGLKNIEAINLDAAQLKKINLSAPLYVIIDPPRCGMHPKTIQRLIEVAPEVIVYISCNIKQLEKELLKFKKHYKIKSVAVFDLFPQTNHMETVVELVK